MQRQRFWHTSSLKYAYIHRFIQNLVQFEPPKNNLVIKKYCICILEVCFLAAKAFAPMGPVRGWEMMAELKKPSTISSTGSVAKWIKLGIPGSPDQPNLAFRQANSIPHSAVSQGALGVADASFGALHAKTRGQSRLPRVQKIWAHLCALSWVWVMIFEYIWIYIYIWIYLIVYIHWKDALPSTAKPTWQDHQAEVVRFILMYNIYWLWSCQTAKFN